MVFLVHVVLSFLLLVSCTSSNSGTPASKPKEAVSANSNDVNDEEDSEDYDSSEEGDSAKRRNKLNPKIQAQLARIYKVDYSFDRLMKMIANATQAIPNIYSIYMYDLEYQFFKEDSTELVGQVQVLSKSGDKTYKIDSPRKSRIKKHFFVGTRTKGGYCGACFFELEQMNFLLGVAYYEKPGPSSGFFTTSVKFLKGKGNSTHILVGAGSKLKSDYKVTGFTVKKGSMELLYLDKKSNQMRLVVKLNSTLDSEAFIKKKGAKNYQSVAKLNGGYLPEFAAKSSN